MIKIYRKVVPENIRKIKDMREVPLDTGRQALFEPLSESRFESTNELLHNLHKNNQGIKQMPKSKIPFGKDPFGNNYLVDTKTNQIEFRDHETDRYHKVADNFDEFNKIMKKEAMVELGLKKLASGLVGAGIGIGAGHLYDKKQKEDTKRGKIIGGLLGGLGGTAAAASQQQVQRAQRAHNQMFFR